VGGIGFGQPQPLDGHPKQKHGKVATTDVKALPKKTWLISNINLHCVCL
jgi:hypothetical protein